MSNPRRGRLAGLAHVTTLLLLLSAGEPCRAQSNPLPPGSVTLVVPLAAGGPTDALARVLADKLGARLDRTVVIENRGGAGGNIGAASVARAEPNGLTWLFTIDSVLTINPHLYASQGFDSEKDLVAVSVVGQFTLMLAINAKVPAQTWSELVAFSKTRSLNFGSAGFGTPPHLAFEYLKSVSKLDAAHVPFRGAAPALTELLAGNVDASFLVSGAVLEHVRSGALRALAVSSPHRLPSMPDVPTAIEAGIPGFEARFANLLLVPARTPEAVRAHLAAEISQVLQMPDVRARFAALATEPLGDSGPEAAARIARERARWGKVIKDANIKLPQ
jgi:tripartite-type tricarboxylate transporter receptor subunit TctC